jgi:hypothetical protein
LLNNLSEKEAFSQDNLENTEISVGSLGKLVLFHNQADLVEQYLNYLPIKSEPEDA